MLVNDHRDELWISTQRYMGGLGEVLHELVHLSGRQAAPDMALNERHGLLCVIFNVQDPDTGVENSGK